MSLLLAPSQTNYANHDGGVNRTTEDCEHPEIEELRESLETRQTDELTDSIVQITQRRRVEKWGNPSIDPEVAEPQQVAEDRAEGPKAIPSIQLDEREHDKTMRRKDNESHDPEGTKRSMRF
jgi:hypothetical protein